MPPFCFRQSKKEGYGDENGLRHNPIKQQNRYQSEFFGSLDFLVTFLAMKKVTETLLFWLLFSDVVSTPLDDRDHTAQRFLLTQLH
jgi:hypothetical protein